MDDRPRRSNGSSRRFAWAQVMLGPVYFALSAYFARPTRAAAVARGAVVGALLSGLGVLLLIRSRPRD